MASPMTHCFVGFLGARAASMRRLYLVSLFCSALPDIDGFITRFAARLFGLHLDGPLWSHRGFSHSLLFALLVGIGAALYTQRLLRYEKPLSLLILYFFALTASHGLIDAITHGGEGVMFFSPFHGGRYLFPFGPVPTARIREWFGTQGLITFAHEVLWIWLPLTMAYGGLQLLRKGKALRSRLCTVGKDE